MSFREPYQTILRGLRVELAVLRAPKLRSYLTEVLCGRKRLDETDGDARLASTVRRIPWISVDAKDRVTELSNSLDMIDTLLGSYGLLECRLIDELPEDPSRLRELIERICRRVFPPTAGRIKYISEPEYNSRLAMLVTDVAQVRRYSVDMGIVKRSDDGKRYWPAVSHKC